MALSPTLGWWSTWRLESSRPIRFSGRTRPTNWWRSARANATSPASSPGFSTSSTPPIFAAPNGFSMQCGARAAPSRAIRASAPATLSGAGDAVLATFAYGLVGALPIEQAMRLANLAAGIVVSKPGTATITLDELRAEAAFHENPRRSAKGVSPRSTKREPFASIGVVRAFRLDSQTGASICCTPATSPSCAERPGCANV